MSTENLDEELRDNMRVVIRANWLPNLQNKAFELRDKFGMYKPVEFCLLNEFKSEIIKQYHPIMLSQIQSAFKSYGVNDSKMIEEQYIYFCRLFKEELTMMIDKMIILVCNDAKKVMKARRKKMWKKKCAGREKHLIDLSCSDDDEFLFS